MQFPFITYGMYMYRQYNDKNTNIEKIYEYMRASLDFFFFNFHILKTAISFFYSVGTSDILSQKHIYFQVSNYTCRQIILLLMVWRYI